MRTARASDSAFRTVLFFGGIAVSVLLIAILLSLVLSSRPALMTNGFRFLTGSEWDPVTNSFHALPFVFGTLITSLIALVIATVLSLALAILMGEYFRSGAFASIMRTAVELLAGYSLHCVRVHRPVLPGSRDQGRSDSLLECRLSGWGSSPRPFSSRS